MKIRGNDIPNTLRSIESNWKKYAPDGIYSYFFVDESYQGMYTKEATFSKMFLYFASLSIIISCLGLFGISLFTAENRIREIGIRKTLGASSMKIVILLSRNILFWIFSAFLISCPIAAFIMNKWLMNFAYRINIDPILYIYAGLLSTIIALITISFQYVKAATSNPANSLRYE
jgi:putative ABC transport system permease protein